MNFTEFALHEDLLKGIAAAGYETCTPVQEQVLKTSLAGDDLYVQSQTGTGKTAAYLVSIIQERLSNPENDGKKTLVLVPTRELAVQVEDEAKKLLSGTNLKAFSFYGGVGYSPTNSFAVLLGGDIGGVSVGYAYEAYTSALGAANGSHELVLGFQTDLNLFKKGKNKHKSVRIL
jgi:superfamily II DNA/RNA helicase